MANDPSQQQYLGTSYPVPTDPNYYTSQMGLGSLMPQAMNADTMQAMFSPQSMQFSPVNSMASNPFFQMFMQDAEKSTRLPNRQP